jgi:predicted alpha/beta hydrolase family esterase
MPNRHFADYKAWKIMFEKIFSYLKDEVIFVGHSLG